jgi:hypothetical protein
MKKYLFILAFVFVSGALQGQTITRTASWTQPGDTLANIQAEYVWDLKIDAAAPVKLVVTCVAPVAPAVDVKCTAPITLPVAVGQRTLVLTAYNAFGQASVTRIGNPPGTMLNFGIVIFYSFP